MSPSFIFCPERTAPTSIVITKYTDILFKEKVLEIPIFLPFRYVFFLDPCNLDLVNRKIKSIALCVSKCPATELTTYSDLKQFALNNGEKTAQAKLF